MEKAIKDFETFYEQKVLPNVKELYVKDKEAGSWDIAMSVSVLSMLVFFFCAFMDFFRDAALLLAIGALLVFIYSIYKYSRKNDEFNTVFKEKIIRQIADYLLPGVKYEPTGFVASKEYKYSGLYRRRYDDFNGDDYFQGIYKGVPFHCSELHTSRRTRSGSISIFKGLFFVANVNTHFTGGTYIWPRGNEQMGASIADERYRLFNFPKVYGINMGYDFDKYFSVFSTSPSEARILLSGGMMDSILKFRQQLHRKISVSFVAGHCYVSIPIEENLMEAPKTDPGDKEEVKKYFFTFLLILSVINQLELNKFS